MNPRRLSLKTQRLLAVGLLLALIAVMIAGLSAAGDYLNEQQARIETLQARIERMSQASAERERLEDVRADLSASGGEVESLIVGETPGLAAANLQSEIGGILDRHDAQLESAQVLPAAPEGKLLRIGLRLVAVMPVSDLQSVLHAIETSYPLKIARNLNVSPTRRQTAPSPYEAVPLRVTVEVFAYMTDPTETGENAGESG